MADDEAGGPRPIVFISHSGYEGLTRATLETMADALRAAGFTPLLDRETITPGTDFHARVANMIAVCHAAVVLMNRRAYELTSKWVFNEVSRLQDRGENPFFQLVVVYDDGLEPQDLNNEDWHLTDLSKRDAVFVGATPDETAATVVDALSSTREQLAAGVIGAEISKILRSDVKDANLLRQLAEPLTSEWIPGDPFVWVATRLVARGKFTPVRLFIRELAKANLMDTAKTVLALVLPFVWVPPTVTEKIPVAIAAGQPVGINSEHSRTTRAYVHCASTVWPLWHVAEIGAGFGGESLEDLVEDARRELDYVDGEVEFGDALRSEPTEDDDERRPMVIVAVPCPGFDGDVVSRVGEYLATRRKVGLMLQGGDVNWSSVPEEVRSRIVYLEPALVRKMELAAFDFMDAERQDLANFYQAHRNSLEPV